MFWRLRTKKRIQVCESDLRPFAKDFLDVFSELVQGAVPLVGPFLVGVRQLLNKLDEVDSRKVRLLRFHTYGFTMLIRLFV